MSNRYLAITGVIFALLALPAPAGAESVALPQLQHPATVYRDADGIARIEAQSRHDLYFLQGWVHASDRLFQMDLTRRQPSGTLAELFGPGSLAGDVEARTIGLRRAAERSVEVLAPASREALAAYAAGVNAWVAGTPQMPPEYGLLGLSRDNFRPWTEVDSVVIAKAIAFSLSFDLDIGLTERFLAYLGTLGPTGAALFSQDVFRSASFDCASTVPDATGRVPFIPLGGGETRCELPDTDLGKGGKGGKPAGTPAGPRGNGMTDNAAPGMLELAARAGAKLRRSAFIADRVDHDGTIGSNEWGVTRRTGANGRPLVANDPHLSLGTPSTFYPVGLAAPGMRVFGSSFAGVPFVILGHNTHIHWGATTNPMDVTDTFLELVIADESGLPAYTVFQGNLEPVERIPESYFYNDFAGGLAQAAPGPDAPPFTFIVPRRNHGPIVATLGPLQSGVPAPALSVQYTGFSATREVDTFRIWNEAKNLADFRTGLDYFDFGSQNWVYGDTAGNVGYFSSAEMPLRADLQAGAAAPGTVPGFFPPGVPIPPWFIRDGTSGLHEWLPLANPQPGQAIPYEILPYDEMPQALNPPAGWFVNANNDPAGTTLDNDPLNQLRVGGEGIYYLNPGYSDGLRAGTITRELRRLLAANGTLSFEDMQTIQGDVSLGDARFFVPHLVAAWQNAQSSAVPELAALAADTRLGEAVDRLAGWDFTAPTGLAEGYDFGDDPDLLPAPTAAQAANSVAATIYSVWRGRAIRSIIDDSLGGLPTPGSSQAIAALRHLLENFEVLQGQGVSGWEFFAVPGVSEPADRRDIRLLAALADALDRLAGDPFQPAFAGSTNQDDYRWGRLHRKVFNHPFVPAFSVPPALGAFPPPLDGLDGVPTDGGFSVVDASSHNVRADSWNAFTFGGGPVRRFVSEPRSAFGSRAESIWAGGTSGVPGSPFYFNLLKRWLVNEAIPLTLKPGEIRASAAGVVEFHPGD